MTFRLLFLGLLATPAFAQAIFLGPGAAYVSAGRNWIATKELDERLDSRGYPTFGQRATSAGVGGYRIFGGGLMLGAELTGLMLGEKPHLGREVGVSGGYATLGIGYVKQDSPRVRWYSRFGVGAGGLTLWVQNADTVTFDSVLDNPQPAPTRARLLTRDGGILDLGFGIEFLSRRTQGYLIGMRTGIVRSYFGSDSSWWLQNGTATNGPAASISGPYVRMTLGGAWLR
jgi:hypothetical protein